MKEAFTSSPFAALSPQEQKEQWIWWQCQHPTEQHALQIEQPAPSEAASEGTPSAAPTPHHGQYNAVLRRMREAGQHAGDYRSWPG